MEGHNSSTLYQQLSTIKGSPRFSLMLALPEGAMKAPFDGASITHSDSIEWIARDSSKPGMHFTWMAQVRRRRIS